MKKTIILLLAITILSLTSCLLFAQEGTNAPAAPAAPTGNINLNTTANDIAKVFQDFGVDASPKGIAEFIFMGFFSARFLRKAIPDQMQTGIVGKLLAHAALEVNPTTAIVPKA